MSSNRLFRLLVCASLAMGAAAAQETNPKPQPATTPAAQQEQDPLKRPLTEKEKKQRARALKEELGQYKKWFDEDVRWIITDEELAAFRQLSNNDERDQFIEQFWLRRDATPDTVENEYKEEHYRRIAYANERFAAGIPGWRTDRGQMYIKFGPPDSTDGNPGGGMYQRSFEEGGGSTSTFPFEIWRYRYLEGIGQEVEIEFVDSCMCGDFQMTLDRSKKDALLNVPGAGLTWYEEMGMGSKADRFANPERLGVGPFNRTLQNKQFERLTTFAALSKAPAIKFKDLEEVVTHKISHNLMPFDVRADFVKVTSDTVLVPITVQLKNRDITFVNREGIQRGVVNIFGRMTTLTGRIAQTFEDTVMVTEPAELLPKVLDKASVYWKALPLRPGAYRLDIVCKDVNGDRMGTWSRSIRVPAFSEDQLAHSSLIVADLMEKVPSRTVGAGNFVIGNTKVRPRVDNGDGSPGSFRRDQKVNFWMQVYNLSVNDQTKRPSATVEYEITNLATKKTIVKTVESTNQMDTHGDQITVEKALPLSAVEPGIYQITIKVDDLLSKQSVTPTARFKVE